jgi:hypothetical protein
VPQALAAASSLVVQLMALPLSRGIKPSGKRALLDGRQQKKNAANFPFKQLLSCTHEAEWTPFQTHYFPQNLVAPAIEPGPLDL